MRLLLMVAMLGLSACSLFQRSTASGYSDDYAVGESPSDFYRQRHIAEEQDAKEELGLNGRILSEDQSHAVDTRVRLKQAEARIATRREKKQYYDLRGALRTDSRRLYFLSLPGFEARQHWAAAQGLDHADEKVSPQITEAIENKDIVLGMSKKAVTESWGDPDAVEVAGNPIYGYQRWKYNRYISGSDGYEKQLRIVYFENGRVVGWERH
jgi:hypothetical protein